MYTIFEHGQLATLACDFRRTADVWHTSFVESQDRSFALRVGALVRRRDEEAL